MKDQAGPIREEGRGAGSRALGVVVLLTRSSTSVGSQVSAGGAERGRASKLFLGGCGGDGGKESGAGPLKHLRARNFTQKNVLMRDGRQVHRLIEGVSGRKRESAGNRGQDGGKVPDNRRAPSAESRGKRGGQRSSGGRPAGLEGLRAPSALAPPRPWATAASALLQALALGPSAELKKMKSAIAQTHHRAQYSRSIGKCHPKTEK